LRANCVLCHLSKCGNRVWCVRELWLDSVLRFSKPCNWVFCFCGMWLYPCFEAR
jgi:hypothetical protein